MNPRGSVAAVRDVIARAEVFDSVVMLHPIDVVDLINGFAVVPYPNEVVNSVPDTIESGDDIP